MAVKRPVSRIIGVEGNDDTLARWYVDRIAHSARKSALFNLNHLKSMSMQMHRMHMRRGVEQFELHRLPAFQIQ